MEIIEDTIEEMKKKGVGVAKAMSSHKSAHSVLSQTDSQASISKAGGSSSDNSPLKKTKKKVRIVSESSVSRSSSNSESTVSKPPTRDKALNQESGLKQNPLIVIENDD